MLHFKRGQNVTGENHTYPLTRYCKSFRLLKVPGSGVNYGVLERAVFGDLNARYLVSISGILPLHSSCKLMENLSALSSYRESVGASVEAERNFAETIEGFSGDVDDHVGSSIGGPVMRKYNTALKDIANFHGQLQSDLDGTLCTRTDSFFVDVQEVKDVRKRFDKATQDYDQVRVKFLSLKKGAPPSTLVETEKEMMAAKNSYERDRFNLMSSLASIESRKKYEFLEAISTTMEAHLRYFKRGYELLSEMEPYIQQVLSFTQVSKEAAEKESRELEERMVRRSVSRDQTLLI